MATTFAADWSKAKAAFTSATQAKKPSASFMGVFNKGPGIGAALKEADAAKTVGELYKAMKAFKPAYEDYVKVLDKAIADPKVTEASAKAVYAAAAAKLKKELADIYTRAGAVAQTLVGQQKKEAVNPAELKEGAEAQQYAALKGKVTEAISTNSSTMMNRQMFDKTIAEFIDQIGNRVAEIRPKGETGGKIEDFVDDGEVKKMVDEVKTRYAGMEKNHVAYLANVQAATKLRDSLPAAYKAELDSVVGKVDSAPSTFAGDIDKELKKKAGRRTMDANAAAMEQAIATLNPRHLEVKAAELSKLYDQVFASCTAAIKSKQTGGMERAKGSLKEAQGHLDRMELVVTPINKDYQSQKDTVARSKDSKDIMVKLNKIVGIHKRGIEAVASAQKQIG